MGSSSREKRRRKKMKIKQTEKKKNLQLKLARIENAEMLTKTQVKNILTNSTCASKVTGKRKRRVTKRLKHLAKKSRESEDVDMTEVHKKKPKPAGQSKVSANPPETADAMDTSDDL